MPRTKPAAPALAVSPAAAVGGKMHHRAAQAALRARSDNLPAPPRVFDPAKHYRVRLARTVSPDGIHFLRPSDDVVISGAYAQGIRNSILGATEVG